MSNCQIRFFFFEFLVFSVITRLNIYQVASIVSIFDFAFDDVDILSAAKRDMKLTVFLVCRSE